MEGAEIAVVVGVGALVLYEFMKSSNGDGGLPPDPNAPFKKDFQPTTPVVFKIDPPPSPVPVPPTTPGWQTSTDSYPMPMCAINVVRPQIAYGASWAPAMAPFNTKEKCLQGTAAMTAATPYLGSWKNFERDAEWASNYTNSPLSFFTGKVWTPGVPDTGCYYTDKTTGNLVQGGCTGWVTPMGLPSEWNYAPGH